MATTSPSFSDDKKSDPSYTAGLTVSSSLNDEVIGQDTLQSSAKVEYSDIYLRARRKVDLRILPLVLIQYVSAFFLKFSLCPNKAGRSGISSCELTYRILPTRLSVPLQTSLLQQLLTDGSNFQILNLEEGTNIKSQLHLSAQQWVWVISSFYYPCMFSFFASSVS